jgi:cathepsin L
MQGTNFLAAQPSNEVAVAFQHFISKYGRSYGTKEEYTYRLELFTSFYHRAMLHNMLKADTLGFTLGVDQFSDMTEKEFKSMLGGKYDASAIADLETAVFEELDVAAMNGGQDWRN